MVVSQIPPWRRYSLAQEFIFIADNMCSENAILPSRWALWSSQFSPHKKLYYPRHIPDRYETVHWESTQTVPLTKTVNTASSPGLMTLPHLVHGTLVFQIEVTWNYGSPTFHNFILSKRWRKTKYWSQLKKPSQHKNSTNVLFVNQRGLIIIHGVWERIMLKKHVGGHRSSTLWFIH